MENPDSDQTPWGRNEEWDKEYANMILSKWDEGVKQAETVIEWTKIAPSSRVLDLGCGVGRHALTFARAGCNVVGIDISEYAIAKAKEICQKKNLKAQFIRADFRTISYKNEFDMVTFFNNTFGILCEEENRWLLKSAIRALKSGGLLLLDTYNREAIVGKVAYYKGIGRKWSESADRISSEIPSFDLMKSRYNTKIETLILKTGEKITEPIRSLRLYSLCELAIMLKDNKTEIISVMGGFDGSAYTIHSEKMVLISRKN